MNMERVVFGFVIILALAINVVFVIGEIDNAQHHNVWILTIGILVNLIASGLKLGDRSQIGALLLAGALVADLLLVSSRIIWIVAENDTVLGPSPESMTMIVSLAYGALMANLLSVLVHAGDTLMSRR